MKALRVLLPLSLLVLSGCSILGSGKGEPVTIYSPEVRVEAQPSWPQVPWSLVIAKPTAARVVDSPRISVRPTPGELQIYKGASWAQPAARVSICGWSPSSRRSDAVWSWPSTMNGRPPVQT